MRKNIVRLIAVAILAISAAYSQGAYWAGVSVGYPGASLHFGIDNVAPDLSVRLNAGYSYVGTRGFSLGADVLYDLPIDLGDTPISTYVGGGLGLGIGSGLNVGVNVFFGGEFSLVDAGLPEGGIFLEVGPAFSFTPPPNVSPFGIRGVLGFNYHF